MKKKGLCERDLKFNRGSTKKSHKSFFGSVGKGDWHPHWEAGFGRFLKNPRLSLWELSIQGKSAELCLQVIHLTFLF
jgi:hypothetical protein